MLDSISISTIILLGAVTALLVVTMLYPSSLLRWLQRKRYQFEVTFAPYMLTSTEKFIFYSVIFLLLALLIIAACFYLPEHIATIANRIFYYCFGDEGDSLNGASKAAQHMFTSSSQLLREAATQFLGKEGAAERAVSNAGGRISDSGRAYMEL